MILHSIPICHNLTEAILTSLSKYSATKSTSSCLWDFIHTTEIEEIPPPSGAITGPQGNDAGPPPL